MNPGSRKTTPRRALKATPAEVDILQVLWQRGPCTVREVHAELYGETSGYTTALKLLQVMHGKGLVKRDEAQRAHVYRAAVAKLDVQKSQLRDLAQRLFDGSASKLAIEALGHGRASAEELETIRELIDRLDSDDSKSDDSRGG